VSTSGERSILHADLDAFFAAVEQLHDPSLRGKPVIVGGLGGRGVVAAASYEARQYGVHSAMPMARARRACPHGIFRPPRFEAYQEASGQVMEVFRSVTPLVEPLGFDEAFLDVSGVRRLHGPPERIGGMLRARVRQETGLVVSVGGASTKHVAKLASQEAKPDGLLVLASGEELAFLHALPVGRLWGVGPSMLHRLERFAVRTVGDLAALPEETLQRALGHAAGSHLHALAHNRDVRSVEPEHETKSIGHEETFATDRVELADLEVEVVRYSEMVASRLRRAGRRARTVVLKVRFGDFRTITRSRTLEHPSDHAATIAAAARASLRSVDVAPGVRLLGVSGRNLVEAGPEQGVLDLVGEGERAPERALDRTLDAVRDRFGTDALGPARLASGEGLRIRRRGSPWGPDHEG